MAFTDLVHMLEMRICLICMHVYHHYLLTQTRDHASNVYHLVLFKCCPRASQGEGIFKIEVRITFMM